MKDLGNSCLLYGYIMTDLIAMLSTGRSNLLTMLIKLLTILLINLIFNLFSLPKLFFSKHTLWSRKVNMNRFLKL